MFLFGIIFGFGMIFGVIVLKLGESLGRSIRGCIHREQAYTNGIPRCSCGGMLIDHHNGVAHCFECSRQYQVTYTRY